jgi:hypothetical protein
MPGFFPHHPHTVTATPVIGEEGVGVGLEQPERRLVHLDPILILLIRCLANIRGDQLEWQAGFPSRGTMPSSGLGARTQSQPVSGCSGCEKIRSA